MICSVAEGAALVPVPTPTPFRPSLPAAGLEVNRGQAKAGILFLSPGGASMAVTGIMVAAISPDGKRVVFSKVAEQSRDSADLWMLDVARGVSSRFTFRPGISADPVSRRKYPRGCLWVQLGAWGEVFEF